MNTKYTTGEVQINKRASCNVESVRGRSIASTAVHSNNMDGGKCHEENEANAVFIAEAFNVTNRTGKTPAQLEEINRELLEALKISVQHIKNIEARYKPENPFAIRMYEAAIQKA